MRLYRDNSQEFAVQWYRAQSSARHYGGRHVFSSRNWNDDDRAWTLGETQRGGTWRNGRDEFGHRGLVPFGTGDQFGNGATFGDDTIAPGGDGLYDAGPLPSQRSSEGAQLGGDRTFEHIVPLLGFGGVSVGDPVEIMTADGGATVGGVSLRQLADGGATVGGVSLRQLADGGATFGGVSLRQLGEGGATVGQPSTIPGPGRPTFMNPSYCDLRLSCLLDPSLYIDATAVSSVWIHPTVTSGDWVSLYNGTTWNYRQLGTSIEIPLTMTAGKPHDVFLWDNAGTINHHTEEWTDDFNRTIGLVLQNNCWVLDGDPTKKYLGTVYILAGGVTSHDKAQRLVFNCYNRRTWLLEATPPTGSHIWASASWRAWNNGGTPGVECYEAMVGLDDHPFDAHVDGVHYNSSNPFVAIGIGFNSVVANSARGRGGFFCQMPATFQEAVAIGRHKFQLMEYGSPTGTNYFYGGDGGNLQGVYCTSMAGRFES